MESPRAKAKLSNIPIYEDMSIEAEGQRMRMSHSIIPHPMNSTPPYSDSEGEDDVLPSTDVYDDVKDENDSYNRLVHFGGQDIQVNELRRDYGREVSTETTIHLSEVVDDPFSHDHEIEDHHSSRSYAQSYDAGSVDDESRRISETFSALPEELEVSCTYRSPPPPEEYLTPLAQRRIRSALSPDGKLLSLGRESVHSSSYPRNASISASHRLLSSPRSPISEQHHSSPFRNPSSIHAMQLSSPSPTPPPFVQSPRSARHRASFNSRNGTPSSHLRADHNLHTAGTTPTASPLSRHPNPKKEYPLILLHCSITPLLLHYSEETLKNVLPPWVLEDITLLKEKLGNTVLERGILIPHPGEDYEVLEERVLESLELKKPRVGKCGHFLGNDASIEDCDKAPESVGAVSDDITPDCVTCGRHVAHTNCATSPSGSATSPPRRWDIKVYAANGLLRASAWNAAWREMEKVDLEVGVWIPDDMRRALELEMDAETEREKERVLDVLTEYGREAMPGSDDEAERSGWGEKNVVSEPRVARGADGGSRRVSGMTEASVAACSRVERRPERARPVVKSDQVPLGTLLGNYLMKRVKSRPDLAVLLLSLLLGSWYLWMGPRTSTGVVGLTGLATGAQLLSQNLPHIRTSEAWNDIPACSFSAEKLGERGMTALPADLASSVLQAWAESTSTSAATSSSPRASTSAEERRATQDEAPAAGGEEGEEGKGVVKGLLDVVEKVVKLDDGVLGD